MIRLNYDRATMDDVYIDYVMRSSRGRAIFGRKIVGTYMKDLHRKNILSRLKR